MSFNWTLLNKVLSTDLNQLRNTVSDLRLYKRCTADFIAVKSVNFNIDNEQNFTTDNSAENDTAKNGHLAINLGKYCQNSDANTTEWEIDNPNCPNHFNISPFSNEGNTFRFITPCLKHISKIAFEEQSGGAVFPTAECYYPWNEQPQSNTNKGCYKYFETLRNLGFLSGEV